MATMARRHLASKTATMTTRQIALRPCIYADATCTEIMASTANPGATNAMGKAQEARGDTGNKHDHGNPCIQTRRGRGWMSEANGIASRAGPQASGRPRRPMPAGARRCHGDCDNNSDPRRCKRHSQRATRPSNDRHNNHDESDNARSPQRLW